MRKIFTTFCACVLGLLPLRGQQTPQYSMYMLNPYAINPAYAGAENTLIATGIYRQQWSGLKGAPATQHINAHLPLFALSSGIGLRVENDVVGAHTTTSAVLSYSYHHQISRNTNISLGLSGGYLQYSLDGTILRAPEGTYAEPTGSFTHNDDLLPLGKIQAGTSTYELGLWLSSSRFSFGLAVQPLFAPVLKTTKDGNFKLQPRRTSNLYVDYKIQMNENLVLKPTIFVKNDITETQCEISVVALWRENIFAGSSYRGYSSSSKDAIILFGGLKINEKTRLGYAYDLPLSALSAANRGSHELLLQYNLNKPIGAGKLPPIIYNPRFF